MLTQIAYEIANSFRRKCAELRDPNILKRRLLNPLPMESQDRYVNRVIGVLTNIEGQYLLNASNMIVDAMSTAQPQEKHRPTSEE